MEAKNGNNLDVNSNMSNSVSKKKVKVKVKPGNKMVKDVEKAEELG